MKHIEDYKLFKESYKEISKNEFVRSVYDVDDFDEDEDYINDDNWTPFTQNELEKIQKIIPDAEYNKIIDTDVENSIISSFKYDVIITKLIDEWYYVMVHSNQPQYFRCDQFDGLIKLLINLKK